MKQTTFITTFSHKGYKHYGKAWIDSFVKNTTDVKSIIYTDFELYTSDSRITVLNFNEEIPEHIEWVHQYNWSYSKNIKQKKLGFKFSHKSFVIMKALSELSGYVIWLDGDCIFKPNEFTSLAESVLNDKFIAVQVDKVIEDDWKTENHVESGIVIFDVEHSDKDIFLNNFKNNYHPNQVSLMDKPYDGFILMRSLDGLEYEDLFPTDYTVKDYDPSSTFTHNQLKDRFKHNIGNKHE